MEDYLTNIDLYKKEVVMLDTHIEEERYMHTELENTQYINKYNEYKQKILNLSKTQDEKDELINLLVQKLDSTKSRNMAFNDIVFENERDCKLLELEKKFKILTCVVCGEHITDDVYIIENCGHIIHDQCNKTNKSNCLLCEQLKINSITKPKSFIRKSVSWSSITIYLQ